MNKLTVALTGLCLIAPAGYAQNFQRKPQVIDKTEYPTKDLNVIEINLLDYNANANSGNENVTQLIQNALNYLGDNGHDKTSARCGGVLYLPEGQYLVDGGIVIPKGVTIRGDWKKPVKGQPVTGTVIKVSNRYKGETDDGFSNHPFGTTNHMHSVFRMEPASQVKDLAFWWMDQNASNPSVYPPAVTMGRENYWGNEGCNVRNITLVNAYEGVEVSELNGEAASQSVYDVYGTALYRGVVIDHLQDVSRVDHCDFSPLYWAGSGFNNAGNARGWMRQNGVAFEIRRNDWSYVCNSSADGYKWGFFTTQSHEDNHWSPNGHNYNLNFTDCEAGFYMKDTNGYGLMIAHSSTSNCDYGVRFPAGVSNAVQFLDCDFQGIKAGVRTDADAAPVVQLEQCRSNKVDIMGGQLLSDDNDLTYVHVGPLARIMNSDSRIGTLKNESVYECVENGTKGFSVKKVPVIADKVMAIPETRPAKNTFYSVKGGEPGEYILPIEQTAYGFDWTNDIQSTLDWASRNGGGIVYLPAGHYRCNGSLAIPTGVELRGSSDVSAFSHGQGTVLEVYANENNENAEPFITMAEKSGMRGITINYPTQDKTIWNGTKIVPKKFPYSVRGNKDVYIVNLALRGAYRGVDLFTNKCDNHYVDYISGHAFMNVVRVGGMSENGTISNIQVNTIVFANGAEGKFGAWPNIEYHNHAGSHDAFYQQNADDLEFFIVGDCRGQNMYNNFLYGCNKGIIFQSDGQGGATFTSLGNAVDGVVNTFVMRQTYGDVDMINTQLVALNNNHSANFFTAEQGYNGTVNMYGTNNWGSGDTFARVESGTINFILSNLDQMGWQNSFMVSDPGKFNMINFYVRNNRNANANGNVGVYTGIYGPQGNNSQPGNFGAYKVIASPGWTFDTAKASQSFLPRNGWKAIAFNDTEGNNSDGQAARNALDGNAASRWTTGEAQNARTHWFAFFPSNDIQGYPSASVRANTVVFDFMGSTGYNDAPGHYKVQVLDPNGNDDADLNVHNNRWRTIAEGNGGSAVLAVTFPEQDIRGMRLVQTGTWTNWCSLAEVNLAKLNLQDDDTQVDPDPDPDPKAYYDLQVEKVDWTPGAPEITAGQKIGKFMVVLRNNGENAAEEPVQVRIDIDGTPFTAFYNEPVPAGAEAGVEISGEYTTTAGGHTVTASIFGMTLDNNSANDRRVRTFNAKGDGPVPVNPTCEYKTGFSDAQVNGKSVVIRRVFLNKVDANGKVVAGAVAEGDRVKISAEIYNNGTVATDALKHGLLFETLPGFDPKYWSDDSKDALQPGESRILTTCGGTNENKGIWTASANTNFRVMFDDGNMLGVRNLPGVTINPLQFSFDAENQAPDYMDNPTGADINSETGIMNVTVDGTEDIWFTVQGVRVVRPTIPGIYIHNGRKVMVK